MNANPKQLLLVDDDEMFCQILARQLSPYFPLIKSVNTLTDAYRICEENPLTHALVDMNLNKETGLSLIPVLRKTHPGIQIVILTGHPSIAITVQAMRLGADNYSEKPAELTQIIQSLISTPSLTEEHCQADTLEFETMSLKRREWEHIQRSLQENVGNISATARALGMHRRTLQRKLNKKPHRG